MLYHRFSDVRDRLLGKVRFTEDGDNPDESDKMPLSLAKRLMNEAEGAVEHDLSPRYMAPFQTDAGTGFQSLPQRPTQEIIKTLCELKSCIRILTTDFGRGTAVGGENYAAELQKEYDKQVDERLLKRGEAERENQWFYPPLPGLRLNWHNTEGDHGYAGMCLNTSDGPGYVEHQINDPSESYWNPTDSDHLF